MTAPVWKRILKWVAWLFGSALTLVMVAYLTLIAINWRDKPPSEAAERLAAAYRDRPPISDADNAYIYTMGLVVGPYGDPREAGMRRVEWMRSFSGDLNAPLSKDPVPAHDSYLSSRSPAIKKISEACWRLTPECAGALERGENTLRAWVSSEQWLLDRYLTLLRHPGWLETVPPAVPQAPFAPYAPMFEGQKLLLVRAYLLASENDAAGVRELLGNDARFWRRVLASSDILITKMMATGALTRTFETGNLVLRRLSSQAQLNAIPAEWTQPFSIAERSMLRCLTGEWLFSQQILQQAIASETAFNDFIDEHASTFANRLLAQAIGLLLLPQDLSNRQADTIIRAAGTLDVPYEQLSASLERARQIFEDPSADRSTLAMLYNPVGTLMLEDVSGYDRYPIRVTDLEGIRRAAVLTTLLRAQKISEQNMAAELEASDLRGPYSSAPFIWNAKERAVEFIGRVAGERGRHSFRY